MRTTEIYCWILLLTNLNLSFAVKQSTNIICKIETCPYDTNLKCCKVDHNLKIQNSESIAKFLNITRVNILGLHIQEKFDVYYLPAQYEISVSNFKVLIVAYTKLCKIKKENFKCYQNLEYLNLVGNELESLDKNLFVFNSKLIQILLNDNKIMSVHYTVFNNLKNLRKLEFLENKCFSISTRSEGKSLEEVQENIQDFCWYRRDQSTLMNLQKISDDKIASLTQQVEELSGKFKNYSYINLIIMIVAVSLNLIILYSTLWVLKSKRLPERECKRSTELQLRRISEMSEMISSNTPSAIGNIYEGMNANGCDNLHYAVSNVRICFENRM